ncbi:MAG: hypothetical protein KF908_14730 [Nitrosomonas sp.]|nr:hypothetical protein [Nitrosomonas sp.]MCW5608696.1 hypothetical protein [Nitrosomonas sp.]
MLRLLLFLFIFLLALPPGQPANAFNLGTERFRISGFGTLGVTSAGKKDYGIKKEHTHDAQFGDVSVLTDSVFGLQLDLNILKNLDATIQAVAEDRIRQDFNNIVDWAYLSYKLTPNSVIRAGRMGIDLFMLSEYRNVGYAYLWTHPVVEFYKPVSLSHYEGFDFRYSRRISPGYFEFKVFGGQTGSDINVGSGELNLRMRPFVGFNTSLEDNDWKLRFTYTTTDTAFIKSPTDSLVNALNQVPQTIWPQAAVLYDQLKGINTQTHYFSAGFSYDKHNWVVQSEFALIASRWIGVDMTNGYLSAGRRIGPVTFYTVGSYAKSGSHPRIDQNQHFPADLEGLATATQNLLNALHIDQNTVSVGLRWDFHPKAALKAQWDHTWTRKHGGGLLELKKPLDHDITLNTFSLNLNFVF